MLMENSSDTTVNRTRHLMACRAVPQPTAQPRAPVTNVIFYILASYKIWCKKLPEEVHSSDKTCRRGTK
jgi:hypothetical protein